MPKSSHLTMNVTLKRDPDAFLPMNEARLECLFL